MNIGETLKYLRENKNYTKKALAEGIVSVSFYSQVESGKSSITIELFFKLLKKLNVTFDEFFLISNGFNLPIETQLWNNFTTAYYEEDLNKLYQAKENIEFELQRQPDPEHSALKIYLLTANLAISRTKYETPKKIFTDELFHTLFSVDTWTRFELVLFINTVHFFDIELITLLSRKLLEYAKQYSTAQEYSQLFNSALINLIGALLKHRSMDDAAYFITLLNKQSSSPKNLYERNMVIYLDGMRLIILGSLDEGTKKVTQSIEIFSSLGMTGRAERYRAEMKKFFDIEIP